MAAVIPRGGEQADVLERAARRAWQADLPGVRAGAQRRDEGDADDTADAALKDAEPVAGFRWFREPVPDYGKRRDWDPPAAKDPHGIHCAAR